jgi:HNH endonuclease/NUMOD4 motif
MVTNWKTCSESTDYLVSDCGKIFSKRLGRTLPFQTNNDGYLKVTLRLGKNYRKTYSVHRLVALAFIPNLLNKDTVNHKDGNKLNNNVNNLEWATRSEQTQHAWDNKLIKDMISRREGIRDKQGKPVQCIETGIVYKSIGEAAQAVGVRKTNLSAVLKGKGKTCGKLDGLPLTWRYI